MKKVLDVAHGVVTSIGGFLEIGSIVAAAIAGAELGFGLLWAFVLGGICLLLLVEMAGRFSSVTQQTVAGAMRARFGNVFTLIPLAGVFAVTLLVLATEIAGVAVAAELATGVSFRLWAPTAAFGVWLVLWSSRFRVFNLLVSLLGLLGIVFLVVALWLAPPWRELAHGLLPSLPHAGIGRWGFLAAVALGASISPALFYFYSSGVLANRGTGPQKLPRIASLLGTAMRMVLAASTVTVAALVFAPRGIHITDFHTLADLLALPLGRTGYRLFVATLGIACFGAAAEVALVAGYLVSNVLGWDYGKRERPRESPRFSIVTTVAIILAAIVPMAGANPIDLTLIAMAATAVTLPLAVAPFLILMNDEKTLGPQKNRLPSNVLVTAIVALAMLLAVATIPLQIAKG
ncbi:MAG: natural resistance-associated macrophage protein [Labilithrix sp.]|nr:natural resistance-associated macrophage protein [Labilithrix sp.]